MSKEDNESLIKQIRSLETRNTTLNTNLKIEKAKRLQCEKEHLLNQERIELLYATQDKVTTRKLKALSERKKRGEATAVIAITDWHAEEFVDPDVIDGLNSFNLTVAKRRIKRTWDKTLFLLDSMGSMTKVKELVMWLGGDLITGVIHEELLESNLLGPSEAVSFVQDEVASGIDYLLANSSLERILVPTSYGNHGRSTPKRRLKTGYKHSWEWLAYKNLERYYNTNPKVIFKIEKGYHNWVNIQGHDVRFHHGDAVKFSGGVGGLTTPLRKKIAQWNKSRVAKLDVLGHFHQFLDDWNYVACGCLVGYNSYALEIAAEYQDPTQTFIMIDKDYGKTMALPIFCEEK